MNESSEMHEPAAAYGAPAEAASPPPGVASPEPWSHPWHDQLGLLYHRAMAEKIRSRPEVRVVAVENIARWIARNDYPASVLRALEHWSKLLTVAPLEDLLAAMTDSSEQGHSLRQNTPFAGILSPEERRRIRDDYETSSTH